MKTNLEWKIDETEYQIAQLERRYPTDIIKQEIAAKRALLEKMEERFAAWSRNPRYAPDRTAKEIGDAQEAEVYQRLLTAYPRMIMTNVNTIGVDMQCEPDIDVQSKARRDVGPQDISHFADSSNATIKMFVAVGFTKGARERAVKRGVKLLTLNELRERYPLK